MEIMWLKRPKDEDIREIWVAGANRYIKSRKMPVPYLIGEWFLNCELESCVRKFYNKF